jgi:hypothetical protein
MKPVLLALPGNECQADALAREFGTEVGASAFFARLLADLSEIYPIPSVVVHAAPVVAPWIQRGVRRPCWLGLTPRAQSGFAPSPGL